MSKHPDLNQLEKFLNGQLNPELHKSVETHVGSCSTCCQALSNLPHDDLVDRLRSATSTVELNMEEGRRSTQTESSRSLSPEIPLPLKEHPRYEIIRPLGSGGMGTVFQAKHRLMGRSVALKVINKQLLQNEEAVKRFHLEIKAASRLSHPNIVTAYDAEQAGNAHFLAMEHVAGTDLSSVVETYGKLSVSQACNYIMQVAAGLQHAHEQGMVHRDIKPQNLMCTQEGLIKILDFGLARLISADKEEQIKSGLTLEGVTLGTPDFISPEQAKDSRLVDIRSDIYSLGCTFYYLLTGAVPFPTGTAVEKVISHCQFSPQPVSSLEAGVPVVVTQTVERMMAKNPEERFQTPQDIVDTLSAYSQAEEGLASETLKIPGQVGTAVDLDSWTSNRANAKTVLLSPSDEAGGSIRSRSKFLLLGAIVGVVLLLLAGFFFALRNSEEKPIVETQSASNTSEWIDLISEFNSTEQAVSGSWQINENGLHVEAEEWARAVLQLEPATEYDYEIEFTRQTGSHSIAMMFVHGEGQATFEVDAWLQHLAGLQMVNSLELRNDANPTRQVIPALENGQRYSMLLQVRNESVKIFLNGELLSTLQTDGSNLSMLSQWAINDSKKLGIGAYNSETTFHQVRYKPISSPEL